MSSTGRVVLRSLISPLTAAVVTLALLGALLAGAVMATHDSITSPDTAGNVGSDTSMVLDSNGYPVVAYSGNPGLKILHCGDPNCSAGNVVTSADTVSSYGDFSLVLDGSGNPVVAYQDSNLFDLKVLHCGDPNCSSGNVITSPVTVGVTGFTPSLVLDSAGNPIVAYHDGDNFNLEVLFCGDPSCSSGNVIASPAPTGFTGLFASLVLDGSGNPVMSYLDGGNFALSLNVLHCGDATCSAGNVITSVDSGFAGRFTSLALDSGGNPVVSYVDDANLSNREIRVVHCGDPNCSSGNVVISLDTIGPFPRGTSLALDGSDNPVIAYYDSVNADLRVLHCGNPNCTSGNVKTSPDAAGDVGRDVSLVLDASGNPVVSYFDLTNADLKVLHCGDPNCSASPSIGGVVELAVQSGDSPAEHQTSGPPVSAMVALAVALAAVGVAGASWRRYRRRAGH